MFYCLTKWYIDQEKENKLMRIEIWWRKRAMWSYKTSITLPTKHQREDEVTWKENGFKVHYSLTYSLIFFARSEKILHTKWRKKRYDEKRKLKKEKRWNYVFFSKYKSNNLANVKEGMIIVHRRLRHL